MHKRLRLNAVDSLRDHNFFQIVASIKCAIPNEVKSRRQDNTFQIKTKLRVDPVNTVLKDNRFDTALFKNTTVDHINRQIFQCSRNYDLISIVIADVL